MNADTFARLSVEAGNLAERAKPTADEAKYTNARNLIVYNLRAAARLCRELSEAYAKDEDPTKR